MRRGKRAILILCTILCCVGCDQITKAVAKSHLPRQKALSFAGDTFRLDYAENKGAVLTFEDSLPERWRGQRFSASVAACLGLVLLYLFLARAVRGVMVLGLSCLCGGTLSNLIDRVFLSGNVVDFLNIGWGGFRTGIFNVADIAISIGLMLVVLGLAIRRKPSTRKESASLEG